MIYDKEINNYASQIQHDITQIKEFIQATRRQKEKFVNNFYVLRKCLNDVSFNRDFHFRKIILRRKFCNLS